jgi:RHS repeat-associated protein
VRASLSTPSHYNYYRDYDSSLGRYVESDPTGLRGGLNTYAYVASNPLAYIDSEGLVGGATESCEHYAKRCAQSGGKSLYYCKLAQGACQYTPDSKWTRCVRQCLQDFDMACSRNADGSPSTNCTIDAHIHCWTKCPGDSCPSTKK